MEILSPAGNVEKLKYAYIYGADAAYIGIRNFSLRQKAENFKNEEYKLIREIKGGKKLYGALNIYFHEGDLDKLDENLEYIANYPFDAFIISDIGIVRQLQKRFPNTELHLSTQANCVNSEAVKMYRDMGFTRVVLGRETSLKEIERIKIAVPEVEIECFVHGAMCLAYSGRCFLSSWMADRSGNQGLCSHSCRWDYRMLQEGGTVLEEAKRPAEYYPVYEGDGFTSILSSKDICMIDHLKGFKDAGVDSLKIEGRMKSIYYTSIVTRAYRKAVDALEGGAVSTDELSGFRKELEKVSHREFSTGFYFGREDIETPTEKSYQREYIFMGMIGRKIAENQWELIVKNQIRPAEPLEFIGPDILFVTDEYYMVYDEDGLPVEQADHGKKYTITTDAPVEEGFIVRKKASAKESWK
ncbi:MAG: U32 family peptidase [Spirochaetales bacterium]|uniref:U32 family peptidase n=1 Tax=Candidatus Thalassospirochaeta sargassi TaxID=3119039 RepID=A0AAJ1IDN8_9SPIO|nr:U32 family peptidase [Spirochaetales bacterium]